MERVLSPSNYPPSVGKFRPEQIAHRSTWSAVPDRDVEAAAMHNLRVVPRGYTTETRLNPLDPGTVSAPDGSSRGLGWLERPGDFGRLLPAGRT